MKIALDAMGGDHAPLEIVKGAVLAAEQYDKIEKIFLVGNKDILEKIPECAHDKLEIVPAFGGYRDGGAPGSKPIAAKKMPRSPWRQPW